MSHLSNSGEDALLARLACDGAKHCIPYCDADVPSVYSIDRCADWVKKEGFQKVSVQFPQDCCIDAPLVLLHMQKLLPGRELVITYNSSSKKCCVNIRNPKFRCGEGVIQFGRSCGISCCPIARLRVPAPCWLTDTERVCQSLLRHCKETPLADGNRKVVILYDMRCAFAMGPVYEKLRASVPGVVMSKLLIFSTPSLVDVHPTPASPDTSASAPNIEQNDAVCSSSDNLVAPIKRNDVTEEPPCRPSACVKPCDTYSCSNFSAPRLMECCTCPSDYSLGVCRSCVTDFFRDPKRLDDIPECLAESTDGDADDLHVRINDVVFKLKANVQKSDISFVYIGKKGPTLTSFSLKLASYALYIVDPVSGEISPSNAPKIIMQRNYKIEQIRDARKIGLLISNCNVTLDSKIVTRLLFFIKRSGKKFLVVYTDHPDLPKLKNYPRVDVFVHIACPETTVVERELEPDLYKVMVTPWELEVALNPDREWSLSFETNFRELLANTGLQSDDWESKAKFSSATAGEYSVSVSLLSNKIQALGIPPSTEVSSQVLNGETGALVADHCRQVAQRLEAGRHLGLLKGEMPWYGLDPNIEAPSKIGTVVEGKKGVAGGYTEEGSC